jgi:hypothetical protein
MNGPLNCRVILSIIAVFVVVAFPAHAHTPATIYVSKLGDDSDGTTWAKAFRSIQKALLAVPDQGGHRVIVRPDTYVEANLYPAHEGAPGAYNTLAGDFDGQLGSGAVGWVVIDSSCPGVGVRTDPKPRALSRSSNRDCPNRA